MASIISSGTTSGTALNMSGDTSGVLQLATNGTTTALTLDASQNATFAGTLTTTGITNSGVATATRFNPTGSSVTGNGMYLPAANSLGLSTNGTNAVYIDSSQNVGIGTTSISNKLEVNGTINIANGSSVGWGNQQTTITGSTATNIMQFTTAAGERMRIDGSGYVGIGTTSPNSYGALAVRKGVSGTWYGVVGNSSFQTSDAANNSLSIIHNGTACYIGTDTSTRLQMFCSASATGGVYLSNGATSWTSASDERVKENLVPIENGLTKVTSLRAVTGNYINDADKTARPFLIAQDVHAVLPEAVNTKDENEWGLAYTDVIPLLVASIKELKAINDTQAETINALTARIVALEQA
jgi:hypothetical protein